MKKINGNIPPKLLVDSHLLAEYREIIRIPNMVNSTDCNIILSRLKNAPKQFVLGKGHVLFFYDKILFLHKRFLSILLELKARGFTTTIDDTLFKNTNTLFYNDVDLEYSNNIVCERICERILNMKSIKINKKNIDKNVYINYLKTKLNER